ncbi:MAG TPA: excinuclease ABC subunit UvrA [Polyangiaceae bacterium]|nr:excinuclease ABC subunit UvrA [Polyangiaceae bacterium]
MLPTILEGAETHNLKGIDLELVPGQVVVVTGVSGAGKSSLAMDTLYAEGQRRFVESFSPYARQFLERLERPPMKRLEPIPAGIAVDRRAPIKSSRSTIATMADLEPYLSALFLREAKPVCPEHGFEARELSVVSAARSAAESLGNARAVVTYPVRVSGTEAYLEVREGLLRDGYRRAWLGGKTEELDSIKPSQVLESGALEVIVDRVGAGTDQKRLAQGIETAWARSAGMAHIHTDSARIRLQRGLACPECSRELLPARPGLFSYESPLGACPACRGFGRTLGVDIAKVIPDESRSIDKGAIRPWRGASTKWERAEIAKLCRRHGIPLDKPWSMLSASHKKIVLEGDGGWSKGTFPGVIGWFKWLETKTYKMHVRVLLARYRSYDQCHACHGKRLNPTALSYRVAGISLADFHALEIAEAKRQVGLLKTHSAQGELARKELESRLGYLDRVGLGYLTLDRQARTLSGGEAQRVTLTAALGTSLCGALFVLDEPTVGLHPTDVEPLNAILRELAQRDNLVLVVEHDPAVIRGADRVIELGPGAGSDGGRIVKDAPPHAFASADTATGRALGASGSVHREPRKPTGFLSIKAASANNLRAIDVQLPLGLLCAVTGPSGSGKSTLAVDIVYRTLARKLGDFDEEAPGACAGMDGTSAVKSVTLVDQSPLGRTSRGNAATYTKAWDLVRAMYAKEPSALALGLTPSDFSFNVDGGRCEACSGEGFETVEMQFLADVRLVCPACRGRRFKDSVLGVSRAGVSVADVLEMTVTRALAHFAAEVGVQRALGPVEKLGLGYLRLGQPLSTLSGGEAQRLKLARALGEKHQGALLVLDEPSAGLHADEVARVLAALAVIVDAGGSVIVVEHDLDLIANADYVLDLGPNAGVGGGLLVAHGAPRELALVPGSRTGRALAEYFETREAKKPVQVGGARSKRAVAVKSSAASPRRESNLVVSRAREHNLHDVSVKIPHGALTVVTGPSGSGKSTLAFDVVFAEGQRRFLETLTPYARQFLPTMPRPDVDSVTGVPPSIALEQRTSRAGGKSTVATVTEVAHYLRLLYAKLGVAHCPTHDTPILRTSPAAILEQIRSQRAKVTLLAPAVQARKGTYLDVFSAAARDGIESAYADGALVSNDDPPRLVRSREHTIDLVIAADVEAKKISDADFTRALRWGNGAVKLRVAGKDTLHSTLSACPKCGFSVPELDPRWFSFATKQGRCETCEGNGVIVEEPKRGRKKQIEAEAVAEPCPDCHGARLSPIPRAVRISDERYHELSARSIDGASERVQKLKFSSEQLPIAKPILAELRRRLDFLRDVGLGYLSLDRAAHTLSGGEMQRLRLAAQLGAGLTGALYVLDEPTIGLHPRDTGRLLSNLRNLVDLGSTVLVVEHDTETIRAADHLIDLGPGGGSRGGRVMAEGTPKQVLAIAESPTGRALAAAPVLRASKPIDRAAQQLVLAGATHNNLKNVELSIPLGSFTVVAGVSGSGKSTLIRHVLLPALREKLKLVTEAPGSYESLRGHQGLVRAVAVDQSPIGRTPRSTPATFLGIWDAIRKLFAASNEAKMAGFAATRFSFNSKGGGQCPTCEGQGAVTHEMSFLPDVVTPCPTCNGLRFEPQTLEIKYLGRSIGEVLLLTAEEAVELFANHPTISAPLQTLADLGAGYITLGQGSHTLSGGEAQRLKLAAELTATRRHEKTLYVLDEPTTGLHIADVAKLMSVLGRLVERGDTLVVIEHHPQVIAGADYLVELGPEGGAQGGRIVAAGSPAKVAKGKTATAAVVRALLG